MSLVMGVTGNGVSPVMAVTSNVTDNVSPVMGVTINGVTSNGGYQ